MKSQKNEIAEVSPGIFIELPKKLSSFQKIQRRLFQLFQSFFSKKFQLPLNTIKDYSKRYSSERELYYYKKVALAGFYGEEEWTIKKALGNADHIKKILIVGSGTGREAFALEKMNPTYKITGIDISQAMTDAANSFKLSSSRIDFVCSEVKDMNEKFDVVFISFSVINHIHGNENRVQFLKDCLEILPKGGILLNGYFLRKINPLDRFFISSVILKIRWAFTGGWEKGDILQSYLGHHNDTKDLEYFHFYQDDDEIRNELEQISNIEWEKLGTPAEVFNGGLNHYYMLKKTT
tara:strand:+ start:44933 stop:45811 length:879 start_codon:yes stop_codon:yes gene_type:complete